MISNKLAVIIVLFSLLIGFAIPGMVRSHEIPYPTKGWEADIYMKIKAQQHAIDIQELDRQIELKRLELELIKAREKHPVCMVDTDK